MDRRWLVGPRVRVDSLRRGAWFADSLGTCWMYDRPDGALEGVYHVVGPTGARSSFAGCAEVVPWKVQLSLFGE